MDFSAFQRELLAHYVAMASLPWAKAAAWHSVNDLATEFPMVFAELPQQLVAAMKERSDAQATNRAGAQGVGVPHG